MGNAVTKRGAIVKAQRVWREAALFSRTDLRRTYGVVGEIKPIDRIVSGERGKAVPQGLAAYAIELHGAGMPKDQILARLNDAVAQIVLMACHQDGAA